MGISLVMTFVARRAQARQAWMVAHLTPYDLAYQQRLAATEAALTPLTGAPQAQQQAYAAMQGILGRQATLAAFLDVFRWIALAIAVCGPIALLMKKGAVRRGPGRPPAEL